MIIRILAEGQYDVPDSAVDSLQELDEALDAAVRSEDEARFRTALSALLARVREVGSPLPEDELDGSDAILPAEDASVEEIRVLLLDDGVIPG